MIERDKIKGFRFDDLNSAGLRWHIKLRELGI
jgi:hypothetical protein